MSTRALMFLEGEEFLKEQERNVSSDPSGSIRAAASGLVL